MPIKIYRQNEEPKNPDDKQPDKAGGQPDDKQPDKEKPAQGGKAK